MRIQYTVHETASLSHACVQHSCCIYNTENIRKVTEHSSPETTTKFCNLLRRMYNMHSHNKRARYKIGDAVSTPKHDPCHLTSISFIRKVFRHFKGLNKESYNHSPNIYEAQIYILPFTLFYICSTAL